MNLDPGQDLCCKGKVQRCLSANRLSFSDLFDDISLALNSSEDYAWLLIVLSVPRKCVILWFPHGVAGMWSCGGAISPKYYVQAIKTFLWCLGLLIVPWKSYSRLRKIGSTILVTNRWNRSHLSWIFSKFLTFTPDTFVLTYICPSPSSMLSQAYFEAVRRL